MQRLLGSLVGILLLSAVGTTAGSAQNSGDSSSTSNNFEAPAYIINSPEPYKRPNEYFVQTQGLSTLPSPGNFGGAGFASPFGGWGSGLGYSPLVNRGWAPGYGGWGSNYGGWGSSYNGWGRAGIGIGGLGVGGFGLGGLGIGGYGYAPFGFGSGSNLGTLSGSSGNSIGNWGGMGGFMPGIGGYGMGYGGYGLGYGGYGLGYGGYGLGGGYGMGYGGMGAFAAMGSSPNDLGRLGTSTQVIQTEPSKASGNYYQPSTIDTTASGSYYASTTPTAMPVARPSGWQSTGNWSSSGNGQSSGGSHWGSGGSPFPKDLNSVPWNK